ncbi:MAG TPA: DUF2089 domain-containing protein [Limnochordia bacterium]|nr:DUF2089 domain-containing protein [Limnochordia bacterium]
MNERRPPSRCPVCEEALEIRRLECPACGTGVDGRFYPGPLARLKPEHQAFVETFVACRGNIKEVERVLGISYPTVRNRLDSAIEALGYRVDRDDGKPAPDRRGILQALERGEMSATEALSRLRGHDE